ncbi:MAG: tetratricopeptide repeat protein [Anaerolineae bacterium]|nr:tetratricopeptide repeat protein [Anaerolineae bacterium]
MSEISLRAYVEYIDDRLAHDAYQEVIAQCRHILETFPKYVEAYKLLARALVAQEDYQDALDLFQRVLSADPSDFISHVGISDCYRESGALDQAIWHLERAFEQVPNNVDLQEAIKQLYAERDGSPPRKVQLTGGALARLYIKGKLYSQAILEIKKALARDPERLDLQLLLAKALWHNHQVVEAGKVAAEILRRLPNCVEANRLLALLWQRAQQPKEMIAFLDRVRDLDPYLAYEIEKKGKRAPADTFQLEMLRFDTDRPLTDVGTADWVSQISAIPKELGVTGPLKAPVEPFADVSQAGRPPVPIPDMSGSPDWLQEALSSPMGQEAGAGVEEPDWLGSIMADEQAAPVQDFAAPGSAPAAADAPDWLQDVLAQPSDVETLPPASPSAPGGAPDWLQDVLAEDSSGEPSPPAAPPSSDAPDWLQDVFGESVSPAPDLPPQSAPPVDEGAPDWMSDIFGEASSPAAVADAAPPVSEQTGQSDMPDWMQDIIGEQASAPVAEVSSPAATQPEQSDIPDWMQDIVGEQTPTPVAEVPLPAAITPDQSDMPDWMQDIVGEQPEGEAVEAAGIEQEAIPDAAQPEREAPQWLTKILSGEEDESFVAEAPEPEPFDEVSDEWLDQLLTEGAESEPSVRAAEDVAAPDWLKDIDSRPEQIPVAAEPLSLDDLGELETWDASFQSKPAGAPSPTKSAELPPFLASAEGMAVEESAAPAGRELPDWLKAAQDVETVNDRPGDDLAEESEKSIPDWLMAAQDMISPESDEEPEENQDEIPDWLRGANSEDGEA